MNILVATDFSDNSRGAVRWGASLASQLGSNLILMHVVDLAAGDNAWRILVETPDEIEQSAVVKSRERLQEFLDETVDEPPEKVQYQVVLGNPIDELLAEAKSHDDPIIVAGTRGASRLQELFLGNTARRLVRQSEYPTILVPAKAEVAQPKDLIVGVDFSDASREAIRRAAVMARTYDASVHLVHGYVLPEVTMLEGSLTTVSTELENLASEKEKVLKELVNELGADDVVSDVLAVQLPPANAIIAAAEEHNAQFIFVGSHGRRGISRFFLGNTAERVMRKTPCPIFVVRPGQLDGKAGGEADDA